MRGKRASWAMGALALLVVGLTSCESGADDPVVGDGRTAAVYESILQWVLAEDPRDAAGARPEWVLFVATRSEAPIDLDVQVAVVDALDASIFVRFIDERSEAVDANTDNETVREDGMLVGLGAVTQEGDTVEVYTDLYRSSDDVEAWSVTVRRSREVWELVGAPVSVEVRPLPSDT